MFIWFVLIIFLSYVREIISCTLSNGTVVTVYGDLRYRCVECFLLGELINSTTCIYPTIPDTVPLAVDEILSTICQTEPDLYCQQFGQCVLCVEGVFADECESNGYLVRDLDNPGTFKCVCYDYTQTVGRTCQRKVAANAYENVTLYSNEDATCIPFMDDDLGYYQSPDTCISPYIGPPPGQIGQELTFPRKACNTYGIQTKEGFKTCHDNGVWTLPNRTCDCFDNFNAEIIGYMPTTGQPIYSCNSCFGRMYPPGSCDKIYFFDPLTGEYSECSGHGNMTQVGKCQCFDDDVNGKWALYSVTELVLRIRGNGETTIVNNTIETCLVRIYNATLEPTASPTMSPTYDYWSYDELCQDTCQQQYQGAFFSTSFDKRQDISGKIAANSSVCFPGTSFWVDDTSDTLVVFPSTNQTIEFLHAFGVEICSRIKCTQFSWLTSESGSTNVLQTTFSFFNVTDNLNYAYNDNSGTSYFCKTSKSPTRTPTAYPTNYPTLTSYPTIQPTILPTTSPTTFCSTCPNQYICQDGSVCIGSGDLQFLVNWDALSSITRRLLLSSNAMYANVMEMTIRTPNGTVVGKSNKVATQESEWAKMDLNGATVRNPQVLNIYWSSFETGYLPQEGSYNVCVTFKSSVFSSVNYTLERYTNNKQRLSVISGNFTSLDTHCYIYEYLQPIKVYMTTTKTNGNLQTNKETLCKEQFGDDTFFYGLGYNRSRILNTRRPVQSANGTLLAHTFHDFQTGVLLKSLYDAGLKVDKQVWMGLNENGLDLKSNRFVSCTGFITSNSSSTGLTASTMTTLSNWEVLGAYDFNTCEVSTTKNNQTVQTCNNVYPILCLAPP